MPQNNNGGSLPTGSDSTGLNVRPELMPESFFFLEKGVNFSQGSSDKFGISGPDANTVFRTTSKITGYTNKIYTICRGQILLQPCGTDATKVNVILKPFNQPIKGLAIKYFIYRGLNKSDFFDNSTSVINTINSNSTGFVKQIRDDFSRLYGMLGITQPTFTAQYIGYPGTGQQTDDLIDDYFYKVSKSTVTGGNTTDTDTKKAYELPMIEKGTSLGTSSGSIGIDIVLNEGDYTVANDPNPFKLNLGFARLADHVLDPATGTNDFEKKLIRETASQFLDIATFYGMHTQGKGKVYVTGQTTPVQTKDEIYDLIKNFATAKTTYLYIQSNRQRSYNFYGDYKVSTTNANNIKIGTTVSALTEQKFEQKWPLQELTAVPSLVVQLTTDNNDAAALYVKQGVLNENTPNEDNFIRGGNLLQEAGDNVNTSFTKPICFVVAKTSTNVVIGSFIQLIYEGKLISVKETTLSTDPNSPNLISNWYMKDIDDVFGLINVSPKIKPKTSHEQSYIIDQNLLLISFENKYNVPDIATVTTKRVEDSIMKNEIESLQRVTYETLLNNIRQNVGSFFENRTAYSDNSNSGTFSFEDSRNNFYHPEKPYNLQKGVFTDIEGVIVNTLSLYLEEGTLPSKKVLGITYLENEKFVELIDQHKLNNPKFFFKSDLEKESDYYTSKENTEYRRYYLAVIGEDNTGALKMFTPTNKIYVSTLDNMVYSTEEYAKWTPIMEKTVNNNIYEKIKN